MIPRRKLLPAIVVSFSLFLLGVIALADGCQVFGAPPQSRKAPGTRSAFETMQTRATDIAAANDKFVDGVITAQRASVKPNAFSVAQAGEILKPAIAIGQADRELAATLNTIVKCGAAGKTPAERDKTSATCAKASTAVTVGFPRELATIAASVIEASHALAIVKNRVRHDALEDELDRIGRYADEINAALKREGVLK